MLILVLDLGCQGFLTLSAVRTAHLQSAISILCLRLQAWYEGGTPSPQLTTLIMTQHGELALLVVKLLVYVLLEPEHVVTLLPLHKALQVATL